MRFTADDLVASVLYRDEAVLVINKPYGIAVHAGPKGGVTLDAFLPDLRFGALEKPQLAHRLDRETTGCLVFGRNQKALRRLGALFRDGLVSKTYLAFVCGRPADEEGVIDLPLARRSHDKRSWWMKVDRREILRSRAIGRWGRPMALPCWHSRRRQAAPTSFACIARRWAGRSRAIASMAATAPWRFLRG